MSANQHQQGQFLQADFFDNSKGLNVTDSPIRVLDEQATDGFAYEYGLTGGFKKRRGHTKINSAADAQLQQLGAGLLAKYDNTKTVIRAAGTKLQTLDISTGATVNLTEDITGASSNFIPSNATIPALFSQFNSATQQMLWCTGATMTRLAGVYSTTKATTNGVAAPTGAITATLGLTGAGGVWAGTGTYFYAVTYTKNSTGAESNATLDVSVTVDDVTKKVTISLSGLTSLDTTLISKVNIYRSAVAGVSGFTTGSLIAQVTSGTASYVDDGSSILDAQNVPRSGNIVLDNGVLPSGTPTGLALWKRRLVTAINSTVYYSELNKPESWPLTNRIQVPSGGPITGLAIISFNTPTAIASDEFLVIFKESEIWIVTGNDYTDVALKLVDYTGCINQALVVNANGYLTWVNGRGVFLWDGSGKPIYCSRPIEYQFSPDGTLDKSKLPLGFGFFHRKTNQIVWYLSDSVLGENKYALKLDLRLSLPSVETSLMARIMDGVFIQDQQTFPLYGGASLLPSTNLSDEIVVAGDASGFTYKLFDGTSDAGGGIPFGYQTKSLDLGLPFQTKRVHKVIVWAEDSSDADLTLEYWLSYKTDSAAASTQSQPISRQVTRAIYDLAYWDAANWDGNNRTYSPVVFNLYSPQGTEGEAITLKFSQGDANAPVSIAGFTIIYSVGGLRK